MSEPYTKAEWDRDVRPWLSREYPQIQATYDALTTRLTAETRGFDDYLRNLARSVGVPEDEIDAEPAHGNWRLAIAARIQLRLTAETARADHANAKWMAWKARATAAARALRRYAICPGAVGGDPRGIFRPVCEECGGHGDPGPADNYDVNHSATCGIAALLAAAPADTPEPHAPVSPASSGRAETPSGHGGSTPDATTGMGPVVSDAADASRYAAGVHPDTGPTTPPDEARGEEKP